jgi:hypothetical protein
VNLRPYRLLLSLAAPMVFTGCLGGATEAVPVTGVYALQSINNSRLPYAFSNGVVIVSETLQLNSDGSFTDVTLRQDGSVVSDQGVYTNFSGTISFADQTLGIVYQGNVDGQSLTTQVGSFSSQFARTGPATK